jgi:uncharacterized membrane protein
MAHVNTTSNGTAVGAKEESLGGLDGRLVAVLGYLVPIVGLVAFLAEEDNDFVRHHGLHSILYAVVGAFGIAFGVIGGPILGAVIGATISGTVGGIVILLLTIVLPLSIVTLNFYFVYNAFTGGTYAVFGLKQIVAAAL